MDFNKNTYVTTKTSSSTTVQTTLRGNTALILNVTYTKYETTTEHYSDGKSREGDRQIVDQKKNSKEYPLREISVEELSKIWKQDIPSFVYKEDDKLFYTEIPKKLVLSASCICTHKCGECQKLSAASDEDGGCEKVRSMSRHIERFPWIKRGFETFHTSNDRFVVDVCQNHKRSIPKPKRDPNDVRKLKVALAQHLYPDIEYLGQIRNKLKGNGFV